MLGRGWGGRRGRWSLTPASIDASGAEDGVAVWDQTQRFVILELVQAHRASYCFFRNHDGLHGGVKEGGETLDDVRDEASGFRVGSPTAGAAAAIGRAWSSLPPRIRG